MRGPCAVNHCDFNPRPPCGGRHKIALLSDSLYRFQSTPPVRGATMAGKTIQQIREISIHAPRAGGDMIYPCRECEQEKFQSTPPVRGATYL